MLSPVLPLTPHPPTPLRRRSKFILADAEEAGRITAEARQADAAQRKVTGRAIDLGDEVQAGGFSNDPGHLKAMIEKGKYTPIAMDAQGPEDDTMEDQVDESR